jgi:UDP-N-acetylmuramate--alanine ligase
MNLILIWYDQQSDRQIITNSIVTYEGNFIMHGQLVPGADVHFMGIGGFGINPIAQVMHQQGYVVSGCDLLESPLLAPLRKWDIPIEIGHSPGHLERFAVDALVISSAIPPDNPEVKAAREAGIPVYKRSDILEVLTQDQMCVAIAGTHGKTTTSGMIAYALSATGQAPSFIVGGVVEGLSANAQAGTGPAFIIEADEYDRMFMGLRPTISVVTTLEMDHPDMFGEFSDVLALFDEFVDLLPKDGLLIAGHDNQAARQLATRRKEQGLPALTYGITGGDWQAVDVRPNEKGGMSFTALQSGARVAEAALQLPGVHNVQNTLAAVAVGAQLGVSRQAMADALSAFGGVERRFQVKGEQRGITVVDDYAHHPTAIQVTLAAAAARYPGRSLWAVWQPHTFSRTRALLDDFAASFQEADHVIVTDVFRSRDRETFGISPQDVLSRMADHPDARHIGAFDDIVAHLVEHARPGDVVIVMSAGDATWLCDDLLLALGKS